DSADKRGSFLTTTATTALTTLALARIRPDHALVAQTVRWLIVSRGANGWLSSIDRAMGVLALGSYAVSTGELAGDYSYAVQLDAKDVLSGLVKPNTAPTTAEKSAPLSAFKPGTTSILALTRDYQKRRRNSSAARATSRRGTAGTTARGTRSICATIARCSRPQACRRASPSMCTTHARRRRATSSSRRRTPRKRTSPRSSGEATARV